MSEAPGKESDSLFVFKCSQNIFHVPEMICDVLHNLAPFVHGCFSPPWVFFMVFKLYKWYQIAQRITYVRMKDATKTLTRNVDHFKCRSCRSM